MIRVFNFQKKFLKSVMRNRNSEKQQLNKKF